MREEKNYAYDWEIMLLSKLPSKYKNYFAEFFSRYYEIIFWQPPRHRFHFHTSSADKRNLRWDGENI